MFFSDKAPFHLQLSAHDHQLPALSPYVPQPPTALPIGFRRELTTSRSSSILEENYRMAFAEQTDS